MPRVSLFADTTKRSTDEVTWKNNFVVRTEKKVCTVQLQGSSADVCTGLQTDARTRLHPSVFDSLVGRVTTNQLIWYARKKEKTNRRWSLRVTSSDSRRLMPLTSTQNPEHGRAEEYTVYEWMFPLFINHLMVSFFSYLFFHTHSLARLTIC